MKKNLKKTFFLLTASLFFILVLYFFSTKIKAANSELQVKIKLQGDFQRIQNLKIPTKIQLLNNLTKLTLNREELNQLNNNLFEVKISLFGLSLPQIYHLFIKPQNYFGRFFASLALINGQNSFDFSQDYFYYGDINSDGKINAEDLSLILKDLGKKYSTSHYVMALYSLKKNISDEPIRFPQPTPTPTPFFSPTPLPTDNQTPTPSPTPLPTLTPSPTPPPSPTPSSSPSSSPTPSLTPQPTTTSYRPINKEKIIELINQPQLVSCVGNSSCDKIQLYHTPLNQGIGYATYFGNESNPNDNNIVAIVIKNRKGISLAEAKKFIADHLVPSQSNLHPEEAKATGKVVAFGATRSCADLWRIKYLFGIDNPHQPDPRFIGRVMIIDCASQADWENHLANSAYSFKGWNRLPWIIDLSRNGFIQLPTGLTGDPNNTGEGRPGVVVIDESLLGEFYQ